jgi:hypothetical protein
MFTNDYGRGACGLVAEKHRYNEASHETSAITINEILSMHSDCELLLVKVDIEGGEAALFKSNIEWLYDLSVLVIELHDWIYLGDGVSSNFWTAAESLDGSFTMLGEHIVFFRNNDINRGAIVYDYESMKNQRNSLLQLISNLSKTYGSLSRWLTEESNSKHESSAVALRVSLSKSEVEVNQLQRRITECEENANELNTTIYRLNQDLSKSETVTNQLQRRITEHEKEIIKLDGDRSRMAAELYNIHSSRLWRLRNTIKSETRSIGKTKHIVRLFISLCMPTPLRHAVTLGLQKLPSHSMVVKPSTMLIDFDEAYYLERYPDIAEAGVDPYTHYQQHGKSEGRMAKPHERSHWMVSTKRSI